MGKNKQKNPLESFGWVAGSAGSVQNLNALASSIDSLYKCSDSLHLDLKGYILGRNNLKIHCGH